MEFSWFIIIVSISICFLLTALINLFYHSPSKPKPNLPPGPSNIPFLTTIQWMHKSFSDVEQTLHHLHSKYGPIISIRVGRRNSIIITSHELAYKALITHGSTFADRPPITEVVTHGSTFTDRPTTKEVNDYLTANQHNVVSAGYGTLWRLLRRNLSSTIHQSRQRSYEPARKWVLDILINQLKPYADMGRPVCVADHFQYAMFCLLVLMCFGDNIEEKVIRDIERVELDLLLVLMKLNVLNFSPILSKILYRKRWNMFYEVRRNQEKVLFPLIQARREKKEQGTKVAEEVVCYVDTLLDLNLPEDDGGRKLNDQEILSLCTEFLNAGTDTTNTSLQWIMANLVKHQDIQGKLFDEIKGIGKSKGEVIKEEDLVKLPYLKAVVLEGLRRHPPGHFVLPHAVTQDIQLDEYVIPKDATINFNVAQMGLDPKVWDDPMAFKPERFLSDGSGDVFDITGSREIKMMPFGAGRRICPAVAFAMLHLEYFVANLVRQFEWLADGGEVDLSEKQEFTTAMKNPLRARIISRN
ncbi:hypothetical protein ACHQM5_010486 [Ranunculus cassubicifolius]